jgi:GDPmannose 4,6-dehydratase
MLQQDEPDDYVIATGETHSVGQFLEEAFSYVGLDWRNHVEVDPWYCRPAEVDLLIGDASKANKKLGWKARTKFKSLVQLMMDADLCTAEKDAYINNRPHLVETQQTETRSLLEVAV